MPRIVRAALIQATLCEPTTSPLETIKQSMIEKHAGLIRQAAERGAQIVCLQELFFAPYFPAVQDARWYDMAERVPDGPTVRLMQDLAKRHGVVLIVPLAEEEITGVYLCYDRHFPEGARCLGLNGAEIVFNPSATVAGLSEYLWKLEQPAHAVANGYFMACSNRVGTEQPWNIGKFYGSSYFVDPRGNFLATASEDKTELITAELDLSMIEEVRRVWQFYRDRRPETYEGMVQI